jgi:hypothetical protein
MVSLMTARLNKNKLVEPKIENPAILEYQISVFLPEFQIFVLLSALWHELILLNSLRFITQEPVGRAKAKISLASKICS